MDENRHDNIFSRGYNYIKNKFRGEDKIRHQINSQVDLQKIVDLQDQDCRNFTLGGLLSCLETIAFRESPNFKKKYDGYNPKSSQEIKNIDQLIVQLRIQSKAFQNMYGECLDMNNDEYWFPSNLTKEDIINDIKLWKKKVSPQYKRYYDNIIYLFEGEDEKIEYPKLRIKNEKKASCDPRLQIKLIPPNVSYINLRRKMVKKNYLEGKPFDNELKLYQNNHIDPAFEKMNERYKREMERHPEDCPCDQCNPYIDCFL